MKKTRVNAKGSEARIERWRNAKSFGDSPIDFEIPEKVRERATELYFNPNVRHLRICSAHHMQVVLSYLLFNHKDNKFELVTETKCTIYIDT